MNDNTFDSLKPPVSGDLDESLKPPVEGGEIDDALDASADISTDDASLKPPVTGG
jgi:hypothetical protein